MSRRTVLVTGARGTVGNYIVALAEAAGLQGELLGCCVANIEMTWLPRRFDAIADRRLSREHREFLTALRFDQAGLPLYHGVHAGIDGCYRFLRA